MDFVRGNVIRVLDGESFAMMITDNPDENDYVYGVSETFVLNGHRVPPPDTPEGRDAREQLEQFAMGSEIVCEVVGKDDGGWFICDIYRDEE